MQKRTMFSVLVASVCLIPFAGVSQAYAQTAEEGQAGADTETTTEVAAAPTETSAADTEAPAEEAPAEEAAPKEESEVEKAFDKNVIEETSKIDGKGKFETEYDKDSNTFTVIATDDKATAASIKGSGTGAVTALKKVITSIDKGYAVKSLNLNGQKMDFNKEEIQDLGSDTIIQVVLAQLGTELGQGDALKTTPLKDLNGRSVKLEGEIAKDLKSDSEKLEFTARMLSEEAAVDEAFDKNAKAQIAGINGKGNFSIEYVVKGNQKGATLTVENEDAKVSDVRGTGAIVALSDILYSTDKGYVVKTLKIGDKTVDLIDKDGKQLALNDLRLLVRSEIGNQINAQGLNVNSSKTLSEFIGKDVSLHVGLARHADSTKIYKRDFFANVVAKKADPKPDPKPDPEPKPDPKPVPEPTTPSVTPEYTGFYDYNSELEAEYTGFYSSKSDTVSYEAKALKDILLADEPVETSDWFEELAACSTVSVIEINPATGYALIECEGLYGYAPIDALDFDEYEVVEIVSVPKDAHLGLVKTNGANLLLRSEANYSSDYIYKIPNKSFIIVKSVDKKSGFAKVEYKGKEGYVVAKWLKVFPKDADIVYI